MRDFPSDEYGLVNPRTGQDVWHKEGNMVTQSKQLSEHLSRDEVFGLMGEFYKKWLAEYKWGDSNPGYYDCFTAWVYEQGYKAGVISTNEPSFSGRGPD